MVNITANKDEKTQSISGPVLILICLMLGLQATLANAQSPFGYRKSITIDHTQVSGSTDLTDFPMLFSVTDPDLRTTANGGKVTSPNGDDILFRALDDATCGGVGLAPCTLDHEIESYTGKLVAWVRIPVLSATSDTTIYVYYGNSSITSPTENPTGVWEANYKGVWHLHDDFEDSTSNNNDGTNNGSANDTGHIADGQRFDGSNDYVQTTSNELKTANAFTISLWFRADDTNFGQHLLWQGKGTWNGWGNNPDSEEEMHISLGDFPAENAPGVSSDDLLSFFLGDVDETINTDALSLRTSFTDTTGYHFVAVTVSGLATSPSAEMFLDGVSVDTDTATTARTGRTTWDTDIRLGRPGASTRFYDGLLDEVRIATVVRSDDWIQTEYNSQSNPANFYTVGSEEATPVTSVELTSFTAIRHRGGVLLRWRSGLNMNNLGWYVYREVDGKPVKLTPELIAGSALMFGPGLQLDAENSYTWWDAAGGNERYWLADKALDGQLTMHGPAQATVTDKPPPKKRRSALLSQIGQKQTARAKTRTMPPTRRRRHRSRVARRPVVMSSQYLQPWEAPDLPPHAIQHALAAIPAIKLDIWERGWYRISQPELIAAGLDPSIDPSRIHLFVDGRQQAIVVTGGEDGRFDAQDAIEFYGLGLDTPWSDTRTYWLVAGSQPGERIHRAPRLTAETASPQSFLFTVERKDRSVYLAMVKNGEAENFFGPVIVKEPVEQFLTLRHVDPAPSPDAQLEIALQGVTTGVHQVIVQLNGHDVGAMIFPGQVREAVTFPIPQVWLQDGENVITLAPVDGEETSVVDTVRLRYKHIYAAHNDYLRFTAPGYNQVTISNFSQPDIRVVDITHPEAIRELSGNVERQDVGYAVTVIAIGETERTLLAFTDAQVKQPANIRTNAPSNWYHETQRADLVIISHEIFLDSLAPFKRIRESQGWRVELVDVQDVYDEFNFGYKSPWALRNFLHHATTAWQAPPRFVLLVGDASFDPRNYLELDDADFVPTQSVVTALLETASDDWFVDFNLDSIPELAIGRLPVRTVEEANTVVTKLVNYAQASPTGVWTREALLVADDRDIFDFAAASREVSALLSPHLTVEELLLDQTDTASLKSRLLTRLNDGQLLVNYIGHGSTEVWAGEALLTSADARNLTNADKLPVVISMNCLNGFFHDLYTESLAESLLKAEEGGAIAVWASSGLTRPSGQIVMNQALMRNLFERGGLTLGEAIMRAKATVTDRDVQRTWILFGDPTIQLP